MEVLTLKQVDNGWILIWDEPDPNGDPDRNPYIAVKEGREGLSGGLIDDFVDTFLLSQEWGDDDEYQFKEGREFQVQINVVRIKPKKRDV